MKNNIFLSISKLIIVIGFFYNVAYGCRITITNDSNNKLSVFDLNSDEMVTIKPHATKTFGNPHLHAKFKLFSKSSHKRVFELVALFEQMHCGENMFFKASDLMNGSERVVSIFKITQGSELKNIEPMEGHHMEQETMPESE